MPHELETEKDVTVTSEILTKKEKEAQKNDVPKYMEVLELTKDQQDVIVEDIIKELDEIEREEKEDKKPEFWKEMDNLYRGCLQDSEDQQFNLSKQSAKIKITAIVRSCKEAFFEADPMMSISPRPEFDIQDGEQVTQKQEDFLDYKFEEVIPLKPAMSKVFLSAACKGTGILKLNYELRRVKKKREERYEGKNEPILDPRTQQPTGEVKNDALEIFLRNYPTASDPKSKYHSYAKQLQEGKTINIVVEYKCVEYNDPMPKYVNRSDFKVRRHVEGYMGLCRSQFHAERQEFTYWDLKKLETGDNQFYNVDELTYKNNKEDTRDSRKHLANFEKKNYEIYECVYYVKLKDSDEEETRCVFWISKERKLMIGSIVYPYYEVDAYYIPFYVKQERAGFDQPGLAEDLKDRSIAEDAILNFTLEGWWSRNMVTPITTEGSSIESQFLDKRWAHGVPLTLSAGEQPPDFLNKYMGPMDASNGIQLIQYLIQGDDDVSGVSSLMTGRESPVDPTAPASKTLALLERSGVNIKGYIRELVPSFNLIPTICLQMYDQMNTEGLKYRVRDIANTVTGANPFGTISRAEMRARTTIQSQASAFNFNKNNEKREDLALYSAIRQEPLVARNPKAVYEILKALIKGWSPKWRNRLDKVLPSFEQFQQEQSQIAVQAVAQYVQSVLQQAQVTKQPPAFDPMQLMAVVQDAVAQQATPPSPEAQKQAQQQQGKPV